MQVEDLTEIGGVAIRHGYANGSGGVRLHYVEAGEGPLVILLHGFPEFWYSWRFQIPALVEQGYRVVAPDLRGYNLSDKPKGLDAYKSRVLAADVCALIDHFNEARASVVGHDWGGGVAWFFANYHPDRLRKLAILNCPHPVKFFHTLRSTDQLKRSWYMFFFQLPFAERFIARRNYGAIRAGLKREPKNPNAFSSEDIQAYVDAIARPGAATGALAIYRAAFRDLPNFMKSARVISAPVLVLWGQDDKHLGPSLAEPPVELVPNAKVVRLQDASHWVQCDAPARVNDALIEFLSD